MDANNFKEWARRWSDVRRSTDWRRAVAQNKTYATRQSTMDCALLRRYSRTKSRPCWRRHPRFGHHSMGPAELSSTSAGNGCHPSLRWTAWPLSSHRSATRHLVSARPTGLLSHRALKGQGYPKAGSHRSTAPRLDQCWPRPDIDATGPSAIARACRASRGKRCPRRLPQTAASMQTGCRRA